MPPVTAIINQYEPLIHSRVNKHYIPGWDREDKVQEARLAVLRALPGYQPSGGACLATFLRKSISNHFQKIQRHDEAGCRIPVELIDSLDEPRSDSDGSLYYLRDTVPDEKINVEAEALDNVLVDQAIERTMHHLGATYERIFDLYTLGLSQREIAAQMGVSQQVISQRLSRIRKYLMHHYQGDTE